MIKNLKAVFTYDGIQSAADELCEFLYRIFVKIPILSANSFSQTFSANYKKRPTAIVTFFAPVIVMGMICIYHDIKYPAIFSYILLLALIAANQSRLLFKFMKYKKTDPENENRKILVRKLDSGEDAMIGILCGSVAVAIAVILAIPFLKRM